MGLMVSSNRGSLCKALLSGRGRTCAGFRVVFAVGTGPLHDGSSNRGSLCKALLSGRGRTCAVFRVVFAVGTGPLHDGSSNRGSLCTAFRSGSVVCRVQGRLRSRHGAAARWVFARVGPPKVDDALCCFSGAPHQAGSSGPRPGRDVSWAFATERLASRLASGCPASRSLEELARPQHGVHHDRELSGDCDRGTLEADPLLELEPPCPERALGRGSRQDDGRGLIEEPT